MLILFLSRRIILFSTVFSGTSSEKKHKWKIIKFGSQINGHMQNTLQHISTNIIPAGNSTDRLHLSYKLYHALSCPMVFLHSTLVYYGTYTHNLSHLSYTYEIVFCLSAARWISCSNIARFLNMH